MAGSPGSPSMIEDPRRVPGAHRNSQHRRPGHKHGEESGRRQRSPLPPHRRDRERAGRGGRGGPSSGARNPPRRVASWGGDKKPVVDAREESPTFRSAASPPGRRAKHSLEDQVRPRQRADFLSPPPPPQPQPPPPPQPQPAPDLLPPPTGPPSKRRRSRSPFPHHPKRYHRPKGGDFSGWDRSAKGKGQPRPPSRPSPPPPFPREDRHQLPEDQPTDEPTGSFSRHWRSRSPQDGSVALPPRRRSRSGSPCEDDHLSPRPLSRHSFPSKVSGNPSTASNRPRDMKSTRPIKSIADDTARSSSPTRPISSFDPASSAHGFKDSMHDAFPVHSMPPPDGRSGHRSPRPRLDTKQSYNVSPQYMTPTTSRHASPQSGSSYGSARGSWGRGPPPPPQPSYHGQQRSMHGYSPPYRQASYPPPSGSQGQYYSSQHGQYPPVSQSHQGYAAPPYSRGGPPPYRGNHYGQPPDSRYSGSSAQNYGNPPPPAQRSRGGHFTSLQWTANGGRGRGNPPPPVPSSQPEFPSAERQASPDFGEDDNPFRPSKDLQVEDEESVQKAAEKEDSKKIPPPSRDSPESSQPKEPGKFSFAFKSKAAPAPAPKPVPDLAQRMREPPRSLDSPKTRQPPPPSATKGKNDSRPERRDDRRDTWKHDRRYDRRDDRRRDRRDEPRRPEPRPKPRDDSRRREPPREKPKKKKILQRVKPRPTLSEEFSQSESVYYRKPGNESVIGAGTYGKVFKAIHVFTKDKVALKRIRMEGEKDGFPITAVREIRLLQHLRHGNIVSLQEVMVEKNECFMVFEYLSHDLTGLINHPTFALSPGHKKHLARQMFDGLHYLHHRGVLHRDIKAANILISSQGELKYADFGLARFYSKSHNVDYTNRVITIWYRPPELLLGETRYGPAVDVWSAACVYMEMFTKKAIFPGDGSEINQLDRLYSSLGTPTRADWPSIVDMPWFELMRPTERKERHFEEQFRDVLSPDALDLVANIFSYDPAKRPTIEEVLAHPYFTTEEPGPQQAVELASIDGDWHEFESKAHRKERDKEARRAEQQQREKEKRKADGSSSVASAEREPKRPKIEGGSVDSAGLGN